MDVIQKRVRCRRRDEGEEKELGSLWKQVDTDGSGALDREEVGQVLKKMGKVSDGEGLDKALAEIDEDGSGEVEYPEFLVWWRKQTSEVWTTVYAAATASAKHSTAMAVLAVLVPQAEASAGEPGAGRALP